MLAWMNKRGPGIIQVTILIFLAATLCSGATPLHVNALLKGGEPAAPFAGISLKVGNETVPPGGIFQFQLFLTEPKPMGVGSTHPTVPGASIGTLRGIALNDPSGQACGVAVSGSNGLNINFISPGLTIGTNVAYPILTMTFPVKPDAVRGSQTPIGIDLDTSFFTNPTTGLPYPQELAPGRLTIGGQMSITDVIPGGGIIPAGSVFSIFGMGFPASPKVQVEGAIVVSANVISVGQIDVTLDRDLQMEGTRIRVVNKNTNETVNYYSYLRATAIGESVRPLLAASYPIFSRQTYAAATLPWTKSATTFTGLAVQNPTTVATQVKLELLSSGNQLLQSFSFSLPGLTKVTRDLLEIFPLGTSGGAAIRVSATRPIQMLGLQGDTASGTVSPLVVTVP